jgi:mRNA-degrading endonuclease RelE of RelBE toxin-antitoxin system
MESRTTTRFWKSFNSLSTEIQEKAKRAYRIWIENPNHPSLHFKQIHDTEPIYSIRIGLYHKALGVKEATVVIWFWIGTHEEYNNLISQL